MGQHRILGICFIVTAAILLLTAAAVCVKYQGLCVNRSNMDSLYSEYVQNEYFPDYVREHGSWPASLDGVEADLTRRVREDLLTGSFSTRYSWHAMLLSVHHLARPQLKAVHAVGTSCTALITFHWSTPQVRVGTPGHGYVIHCDPKMGPGSVEYAAAAD